MNGTPRVMTFKTSRGTGSEKPPSLLRAGKKGDPCNRGAKERVGETSSGESTFRWGLMGMIRNVDFVLIAPFNHEEGRCWV